MDKRFTLTYNETTQVVEFYPSEGVPTGAVTYSVWAGYNGEDNTAEFSGTASSDTYSQAVTTASGYSQTNRRRIYVASTANIAVGRFYRVRNALGQYEVIRCVAFSANAYVEAEYDLAYDYPITTSYLEGFRQYFTPPSAFLQDEDKLNAEEYPYRLRWSYTVDALPRRHLQWFDVVRGPVKDGVQTPDLSQAWPDLPYKLEPERQRRLLDEARIVVNRDLLLRGVDPVNVADGPLRDQLVKDAFVMLAIRSGSAVPQGYDAATALRTFTRAYLDGVEMSVAKLKSADNRQDGNLTPGSNGPGLLLTS